MSKTQSMLKEAIELYGLNDERTMKINKQRDKEIVEEQKEIYKKYKEVV